MRVTLSLGDVVFGTHNIGSLPVLLERARHNREAQVEIVEALQEFPSALPATRESSYSAWVSISVGCNNTCTFCIVPSLRGKEVDRRPGDILAEVQSLVDQGVLEITLLGQNVNAYRGPMGDGEVADLGAGSGVIADALLRNCPAVRAVDLYEADARALALAERNLAPHAQRAALGFHWHDVTTGLPRRYDVIVSNPPFHAHGREGRPDIGRAFIGAAAAALKPGGALWLVANRHLPYEDVLDARFGEVSEVASSGAFKVIHAVRARAAATRARA